MKTIESMSALLVASILAIGCDLGSKSLGGDDDGATEATAKADNDRFETLGSFEYGVALAEPDSIAVAPDTTILVGMRNYVDNGPSGAGAVVRHYEADGTIVAERLLEEYGSVYGLQRAPERWIAVGAPQPASDDDGAPVFQGALLAIEDDGLVTSVLQIVMCGAQPCGSGEFAYSALAGVVWTLQSTPEGLVARRTDLKGAALGPEMILDSEIAWDDRHAMIATDDGRLVHAGRATVECFSETGALLWRYDEQLDPYDGNNRLMLGRDGSADWVESHDGGGMTVIGVDGDGTMRPALELGGPDAAGKVLRIQGRLFFLDRDNLAEYPEGAEPTVDVAPFALPSNLRWGQSGDLVAILNNRNEGSNALVPEGGLVGDIALIRLK